MAERGQMIHSGFVGFTLDGDRIFFANFLSAVAARDEGAIVSIASATQAGRIAR